MTSNNMIMSNNNTIKQRYEQLSTLRQPFLERARDCSKLTIPTLIPPDGWNRTSKFTTPYQGIGARGVNNLASKLLMALLPPNTPFFRYMIEEWKIRRQLEQNAELKTEIDYALSQMENTVIREIEGTSIRIGIFEGLKHLIIGGNVLMYFPNDGGVRVFHLDRFVVKRDPQGLILEIITKESTVPEALTPETIKEVGLENIQQGEKGNPNNPENTIDIFTRVKRNNEKKLWEIEQEINGKIIPFTKGSYALDACPWIVLRFSKIDNEDYGRGYVEEYLGDLISLEALTKSIVQGSVAAAKILFMVKPNSSTQLRTLVDSKNGDVVSGNAEDVTVLKAEKVYDFRTALETMQKIEERLSFAFLLNMAVQRQAERVTATEISYMAGELEDALGGVYSILSQEMQLPLVQWITHQMMIGGKLPPLPKGIVRPVIVTGLEALGRGHEQRKLNAFLQQIQILGPEVIAANMKVNDYIKRCATNYGIDTAGLVKTDKEIAADQERMAQAQQQQMLTQTALQKGPDYMRAAKEMKEAPENQI